MSVANIFHRIIEFRDKYPIYYYVIALVTVYAVWKGYKEIYYTTVDVQSLGWRFNDYLAHTHQYFISWMLDLMDVNHQKFIVENGPETFPAIRLPNAGGVYMGHHCLAVTVCIVYGGVLMLLKGSMIRKIIFLVIGLAAIYFINSARIMAMVYLDKYASPTIFEVHHNVINVMIVYTFTMAMHMLFMFPQFRKYLKRHARNTEG